MGGRPPRICSPACTPQILQSHTAQPPPGYWLFQWSRPSYNRRSFGTLCIYMERQLREPQPPQIPGDSPDTNFHTQFLSTPPVPPNLPRSDALHNVDVYRPACTQPNPLSLGYLPGQTPPGCCLPSCRRDGGWRFPQNRPELRQTKRTGDPWCWIANPPLSMPCGAHPRWLFPHLGRGIGIWTLLIHMVSWIIV